MSKIIPIKKLDNEIRSIIVDIVEKGNFPSNSFDIRHIEKIDQFNVVSTNKVQFGIDRHPHLFGKPTLGMASSAFIPKYYLYELDIETKTVQLVKKEKGDPVVDIDMLADENVSDLFTYGDPSEYYEQFKNINSEEEAVEFAKKEFDNNEYWAEEAELKSESVPTIPDFKEEYLESLKICFVSEMVSQWEFYKAEVEFDE
jgi:hypothetical protein